MIETINRRMNRGKKGEWYDERMNDRKGERMDGWEDGRVKVYMDKNMEGWKYIWLRTWKGERVDGWEDGWTNEWMVSLQGLSVY